jgi:hypothetical protein
VSEPLPTADPVTRGPETGAPSSAGGVSWESTGAEERPGFRARLRAFGRRPAVRAGLVGLAVGLALAVALPLALVAPYVADDVALDRIVRAVALDWRDFGEPKARERLEYELDHQGIGAQVRDGDCALGQDAGERFVACRWTVPVTLPGTELVWPLSFASTARIDAAGDLR